MSKSLSGRKLVIVESPTKAKTIRKFLGKDYIVESCMGHVRDLPQSAKDIPDKFKKMPWANLGVNVDEGFEPLYLIPKNKTKVVSLLKEKLSQADGLILATDEDREGESISWHLLNVLKPKVPVKRMVFNEITKEGIEGALKELRDVDMNLVKAQEARRVLDRLVGYTISPVLWKKVAYGLSAGRVQSVAVRLVAEREHERLKFKKATYWDVTTQNEKDAIKFNSRLISYDSKRIATGKDFDPDTGKLSEKSRDMSALTEVQARDILTAVRGQNFTVNEVEEKPVSRKPAAPFITSTLQQDANRKLGWSSRETMQVAQKLYENGLITYMRTDSTALSEQALKAARDEIKKLYGKDYLPDEARDYSKKKVKGAQEAHEAIRPAGTTFVHPDDANLSAPEKKLYDLIWKRTMASQMVNSEHKQISVRFGVGKAIFSTSGMTVEFPGFLKAYVEGSDDPEGDLEQKDVRLPAFKKGDSVKVSEIKSEPHETKPPARFTEASLVQTLEKMGIGRPSTYASIMGTIQDRGYVRKTGNALVPTFTALAVTNLLSKYFPVYVDFDYTSGMENTLDEIASGDKDQQEYLASVYFGKTGLKETCERQVSSIDEETSRAIFLEGLSDFSFRIGRYGAYVCRKNAAGEEICASIPDAQSPGDMTGEIANQIIDQKINGADSIGKTPEGLPVYVLNGRYGPYVQSGEADSADAKPKRMALPPGMSPEQVTLDKALYLLTMPRSLGDHPLLSKDVKLGIGRFGPYVVCDGDFRSVPKTENLFEMNLEKAMLLMSQPKKGRGRAAPLKEFGPHPRLGEVVQILTGKYGPYIKCGVYNVSIPQDKKPEEMTLEQALNLLDFKIASSPEPVAKAPKKARATAGASRGAAATGGAGKTKARVGNKADAAVAAKAGPAFKPQASKKPTSHSNATRSGAANNSAAKTGAPKTSAPKTSAPVRVKNSFAKPSGASGAKPQQPVKPPFNPNAKNEKPTPVSEIKVRRPAEPSKIPNKPR